MDDTNTGAAAPQAEQATSDQYGGSSRDLSFCIVPVPSLVYAGPRTREEFDRIPLKPQVFDWEECSTLTLLKGDGQPWQRRATVKVLGDHNPGEVTVVFQWFDERPLASREGGAQ